MSCSQGFVFIVLFYIVAFIYVFDSEKAIKNGKQRQPGNYKYFGYIMLIIVYILSIGLIVQNLNLFGSGFNLLKDVLTEKGLYNIFLICAFSIGFFNLYSLIKILNAYWFKSNHEKTFNLKLSDRHIQNLKWFDNSFVVGIVSMFLFIMTLLYTELTSSYVNINQLYSVLKPFIQGGLFFISFICVWVGMVFSTRFSYIKRD
jgi:hypothetical protein